AELAGAQEQRSKRRHDQRSRLGDRPGGGAAQERNDDVKTAFAAGARAGVEAGGVGSVDEPRVAWVGGDLRRPTVEAHGLETPAVGAAKQAAPERGEDERGAAPRDVQRPQAV